MLKNCGVDTNISSAIRHAPNLAAKRSGVSINIIKSTAGWTKNSETFARFYDLLIKENENAFANAILSL